MAKPYHIKLKRIDKTLGDATTQAYNDLKWGEPIVTKDGYVAVGDKTSNVDENGDYLSQNVGVLKVLKSISQELKDNFTFWKNGESTPATGTHVTLTKEDGTAILPDTDARYVSYNGSTVQDSIAPLDSPEFVGTPTAPDIGSNPQTTSQVATKNYVDNTSNTVATNIVNTAVSGTAPTSTSYYLTKFTGTHSVGNGPLVNTSSGATNKFLNERGEWVEAPLASSSTRGGIKLGYTTSGNNYAVQVSDEKAFVNVPWTDTKVTQTNTTGNADYRILFSNNANDTTETVGARKNTSLKYNPSTTTLTVPNISVGTKATIATAATTTLTATTLNGVTVGSSPKFTDTNTLNTAGSTNSTSKLFLIGATSQASNPQTYSNSAVYATNGTLTATSASFSKPITVGTPTADGHATTKKYVDDKFGTVSVKAYEVVTALPTSSISTDRIYILKTTVNGYTEYVPYFRDGSTWVPISATW